MCFVWISDQTAIISLYNFLWVKLCKTCIIKLGPDDDLEEVETCRPFKLKQLK